MSQGERGAIRHGQGLLEAPEGTHLACIADSVAQRQPVQKSEPDAMTKDHRAIQHGFHVDHEGSHAGLEFGEGVGVRSKPSMRIWIVPVVFHKGFTLRAVHAVDQCRIDYREFMQAVVYLRCHCMAVAERGCGFVGADKAGYKDSRRRNIESSRQDCGLAMAQDREWDSVVRHRDTARIRDALGVPDECDRFYCATFR